MKRFAEGREQRYPMSLRLKKKKKENAFEFTISVDPSLCCERNRMVTLVQVRGVRLPEVKKLAQGKQGYENPRRVLSSLHLLSFPRCHNPSAFFPLPVSTHQSICPAIHSLSSLFQSHIYSFSVGSALCLVLGTKR